MADSYTHMPDPKPDPRNHARRRSVAGAVLTPERFRCQECGQLLARGADPNRARCRGCGGVDFDLATDR